jgi:hypothetical protein
MKVSRDQEDSGKGLAKGSAKKPAKEKAAWSGGFG